MTEMATPLTCFMPEELSDGILVRLWHYPTFLVATA